MSTGRFAALALVLAVLGTTTGCQSLVKRLERITASPTVYGSYSIGEGRDNEAVFGASITFYERGERPAPAAVPQVTNVEVTNTVYGSRADSSSGAASSSFSSAFNQGGQNGGGHNRDQGGKP